MNRPENLVRSISSEGNQGHYEIYLVGFPRRHSHREPDVSSPDADPADWTYLAPHLAPEARVFNFDLFGEGVVPTDVGTPSIDNISVASSGSSFQLEDGDVGDIDQNNSEKPQDPRNADGAWRSVEFSRQERSCSAQGLRQEAHFLLDVSKEQDPASKEAEWRPIIYVGYGLGGIVVKQAMVIANTDPRYCDVALRTHKLIFLATPDKEDDLEAWEECLDQMIKDAGVKIKGRKSRVLAELANSVQDVVSYFRCALNYRIEDLAGFSSPANKASLPLFTTSRDDSCRLQSRSLPPSPPSMTKGLITKRDLRCLLFPGTLLTDYMWDIEQPLAGSFYSDLLDFLQVLSPSNHPIHRSTVLLTPGEDLDLEVYTHHISNWQDLEQQHWIQVIGPSGCGKATLMRFVAQKIMRDTSNNCILLEMFLEPLEMADLDLLTLLRSFVYQIVSQRPALFSHIRPLYLELDKSHGMAREDEFWTFLKTLLRVSQDWRIIIALKNVHLWPKAAQSALKTLQELFQSLSSKCMLISSSASEIPYPHLASRQVLDLGMDNDYRDVSVQGKIRDVLLAQPAFRTEVLPERFQGLSLPKTLSLSSASCYTKVLSRAFLLSTVEAADAALRNCPKTDGAIFQHGIETLHPDVLSWSSSAISWTQKAARPLRTRELAVAVALGGGAHNLAKLIPRIPASIETDIYRHLDVFLRVNSDIVHLASAATRKLLDQDLPVVQERGSLQLLTHAELVDLCLQYISTVVAKVPQGHCLEQVTWREQVKDTQQRQGGLQFLDYAVRHWPTHYRAHIQLEGECKRPNQEEGLEKPLNEPGEEPDDLDAKVLSFLTNDISRTGWYQLHHARLAPEEGIADDVGALEVATELGLSSIVDRLLPTETEESAKAATTFPIDLGILLRTAVRYGYSDLVNLFLSKGAKRKDAVLEAACLGQVEYLEKLIPDELLEDDYERLMESAVSRAAQAGSLPGVEFFDKISLDWTWKDSKERTVLHAAAIGGNVDILNHITRERALGLNQRDKDGRSPLMMATRMNHVMFVKALLNKGADAKLGDMEGRTALHHAVIQDPDIVTLLLQYGASSVQPDKEKKTPLHLACRLGDLGVVTHLVRGALKSKESINPLNEDDRTPLHIAASSGHSAIIEFLLDRGADISAKDSEELRPIDLAAAGGHLGVFEVLYSRSNLSPSTINALVKQSAEMGQLLIVQFLLEKISKIDFWVMGQSPLTAAASKGYTEVVRLLLEEKADPGFSDDDGRTPLDLAASGGHTEAAIILLKAGADPNVLDERRWTPLHHAASRGLLRVAEALLNCGVNVNARTILKETALHFAVAHPDMVQKLLEKGETELAPFNYNGETPLHLAVKGGYVRTVRLLVRKNRDLIHIPNEDGYTALHQSMDDGPEGAVIFDILWSQGGLNSESDSYRNNPPLIYALRKGRLDVVRFFLTRHPAMVAIKDPDGQSPLHMAAIRGDKDTVQKLIDLGADLDAVNNKKETAVYLAAWHGRIDAVKCLLDARANPNLRSGKTWAPLHAGADSAEILDALLSHEAKVDYAEAIGGWTALMIAVFWGNEQGIPTILSWKADINIGDGQGRTALHFAEEQDNPRLSEILLDSSAKVDVTDDLGKTPLHYATGYGFAGENDVIKVQKLLEKGAVVNCEDTQKNSPLHSAASAESNSQLVVKMLIELYQKKNLSIDEKNNEGRTPFHQALCSGTYETSKILFDMGASLDERDSDGKSCLALATSGGDKKRKIELLLNVGGHREGLSPPWTLDDKVAAFMEVIGTDWDAAKCLAENDKNIFQVHNDASTVLRLCLDSGQYKLAREFLQLGADPFYHEDGQLSAFQRAGLAEPTDRPFKEACLEMLSNDRFGLHPRFQALRLSIEKGWTDVTAKLRRWQPELMTKGIVDQDGWTINHFFSQSDIADSIDGVAVLFTSTTALQTPNRLVYPKLWKPEEDLEEIITISPDGKKVQCLLGDLSEPSSWPDRISVRANYPFQPRGVSDAVNYFEVDILPGEDKWNTPAMIGVGVCGEFVDLSDGFPGWSTHAPSLGYHGDDGRIYDSTVKGEVGIITGKTFTEGDTVGCGIDWNNRQIYYTLNGDEVGRARTPVIYRKLYPIIALEKRPCAVAVNFGEDEFKFSVPVFKARKTDIGHGAMMA
ncbi:hypothetical protein CDV36_002318 [Fusarium kuroshium]|uniref:B30.2/SPRY domain-containing protein n=1 Tax=Fusarium kuroshium TaxID=2010991 RepID=A0A3M2SKA8_9HYPO|nr:hypothetical protein CDV36_002318 [Fusarium kuroshium]